MWYESRQIRPGEKFTQKIESFFSEFKIFSSFPLKIGNLREAYIQKFPYIIIYEIVVFAVFNTYQNPQLRS